MRSGLIESHPASHANGHQPMSNLQRSSAPPPMAARRVFPLAPGEGWLPLLLLAVAVYSVVYSVTAAITVGHSEVLWITTALGLFCGLGVAKSRYFPQAALHICTCILGYWLALFVTSFLAYRVSLLVLLASLRTVITGGFALTNTPQSEMVFLFYLAFLCFFLGYFGSWLIYRAHLPWLVSLVYVAIMLVNMNYIAKRDLSLLLLLLVGSLLLLIARMHLANQLAQWKSDGLYTDARWLHNLTVRFLRVASLFVLLILSLSWLLPIAGEPTAGVTFWNNLDNAWTNIAHGNLSSLSNPGTLFSPYNQTSNFFSDQLTITGSVNLPTGPVLAYTTGSSSQGQYLEGFTFDTFDGHTWTSQVEDGSQTYEANVPLPLDNTITTYKQLITSVKILQPPGGTKSFIFAPAQPSSFSVPVTLLTNFTGTLTSAWTQTSPLRRNESYQVVSNLPGTSPAHLSTLPFPPEKANFWQDDPNYATLQQYYLQKPSNLSPEVLRTAQTWTNGADNMYSAVIALQAHLSNSADFTYSVTNQPIPTTIDAVTWLLHTHRGYCTYYATAMTVMARLLGLPARIVNGFSQGHYDAQQQAWMVNGSDAHSWVQVYFPTFGWITFDPTPGFAPNQASGVPPVTPKPGPTKTPIVARPTATPQGQHGQPTVPPSQANRASSTGNTAGAENLLLVLSLLVLVCSLVAFGFSLIRYRASRVLLAPAAAVYTRLCRVGGLLGAPPIAWQTPYEYTFALSKRFPQATMALRRVADLFVRERWASPRHMLSPGEAQELQHLWPRLRALLLRSRRAQK